MLYQTQTARMQAAVSVHCCHPVTPHPGGHAMVSSAADCCVRPTALALLCIVNGGDSAVFFRFLSTVTLTFDLDIQTRPSEGPNTSSRVNLAKIRSAVPEIFHAQPKKTKKVIDKAKTEPYLRAVIREKNKTKVDNQLTHC